MKLTALLLAPCLFSILPFFSGVLLCYSILVSRKKLKFAYRRIIFVMTIFDLFISIGGMLTPFRATQEMTDNSLAVGNHTSAVIFTAIMVFGIVGSQMYNVSLSVYYLYLIKYNYRERKFTQKVEPYVHMIPIMWAFIGVISCLATQSFNPGYNNYFLNSYPNGCNKDDEIDCTRGKAAPIMGLIFGALTLVVSLLANILILLWIWRHVYTQEKKADAIRLRRVSTIMQSNLRRASNTTPTSSDPRRRLSQESDTGVLAQALASRRSQIDSSRRNMSRRFLRQAFWYLVAFLVCYGTNVIVFIIQISGKNSDPIPFGVRLWTRIVRPLHGIFNMLIFTYPHTRNKRKEDPSLSYFSALLYVIRAGCDNDENDTMSARRNRTPHSSFRLPNRRSQKSTPKRNVSLNSYKTNSNANAMKGQEDQIGKAHGLSNFASNTAPTKCENDPERKDEAEDDENIKTMENNLASTTDENDEGFNETNQNVQSDEENGDIVPSSVKENVFNDEEEAAAK